MSKFTTNDRPDCEVWKDSLHLKVSWIYDKKNLCFLLSTNNYTKILRSVNCIACMYWKFFEKCTCTDTDD